MTKLGNIFSPQMMNNILSLLGLPRTKKVFAKRRLVSRLRWSWATSESVLGILVRLRQRRLGKSLLYPKKNTRRENGEREQGQIEKE